MYERLAAIAERYEELERELSRADLVRNPRDLAKLGKERSGLEEVVARYRDWQRLREEIAGAEKLLEEDDAEMRELGRAELGSLREREAELESELKRLLLPKDPRDERNVI